MSASLREHLRAALAASPAGGPLAVGFSGGPDSTALLHALAQLPEARERGLRALHVDHGLNAASPEWANQCTRLCTVLGVPLTTIRVTVDEDGKEGLEAAARRARYVAFAGQMRDSEWLALAHHRDDQVETVLLKLLRGAGPEGLGGMRTLRPFSRGFLWRPLLEITREVLRKYLTENELPSIDDPANRDARFTRNVLRTEIIPELMRHWPNADTAILHTARLCREASDCIAESAQTALADLQRDAHSLDAAGWLALPVALRAPVLDAWLHARGLPAPPDAARRELEREATAATDRKPQVRWPGAEVHVWHGALHATPHLPEVPRDWQAPWNGSPLTLPADGGVLTLETTDPARPHRSGSTLAAPLMVRFPHGGERIKPDGDAHSRDVRELLRRARTPPWLRERCPLIIDADQLIAVADLWMTGSGHAIFDACCASPHWQRPNWA